MNPANPPVIRRRRLWPWVLLAVLVAPFLLLGAAAVSVLTLDRDAAFLRGEVVRAAEADLTTRVQVSVPGAALAVVRACLVAVDHEKVREARLALAAVRSVSVGVYELESSGNPAARERLMNETDRTMQARGWARAVGVHDGDDLVMIYLPDDTEDPESICLAVVSGRELVVVSAEIRPDAVRELVERHVAGRVNLTRHVRMAMR